MLLENLQLNTNNSSTLKNIFQYTDIAIFINNNSSEFSAENTLKNVSIENINFISFPKLGNSTILL